MSRVYWTIWTDTTSLRKANNVVDRVVSKLGRDVVEVSVEPYEKGGHEAGFQTVLPSESWADLLFATLSLSEALGSGWTLHGSVIDSPSGWLSSPTGHVSVPGVRAIQWSLPRPVGCADTGNAEIEAGVELLRNLHLSAPERSNLPDGRVYLSGIQHVVQQQLDDTGWFPRAPASDDLCGAPPVLQASGSQVLLHVRLEEGVGRFGPAVITTFGSLERALHAYVAALGGSPLDGIEIT